MEILRHPHPALQWESRAVQEITSELRATIEAMFALMYAARGVGLAANQVGLPFRFFVINIASDPEEKDEEFVFINPEITRRKGSAEGEEGCLSLPELYGPVRRAEEIVVDAFDLQGQGFQMSLEDLPARVVQHETDHLDGIMFIDRMTESSRRELEPQIQDFERQFEQQQKAGTIASNEELRKRLEELDI